MNFFEELEALRQKTFRLSAVRLNNINSEYTMNTDHVKNCYLIANAVKNEDCYYGRDFYNNTNCMDCDHIFGCTLCYECVNCRQCWNASNLQDSNNCVDCDYGYDLKDCQNCIGCVGLRKKQFHIFNQPYSKESFYKLRMTMKPEMAINRKEILEKFNELKLKVPRVNSLQIATENCFGDNIYNCKNTWYSFDVHECQDCGYIEECKQLQDCWDNTILEESQFCYQISSSHILNNCNFCFQCLSSNDCEFCEFVMNSSNCFGCISLNHKQYYILNQPYQKEEYFKRIAEIKEQLRREKDYGGRFWSPTFPLQDTVAAWDKL